MKTEYKFYKTSRGIQIVVVRGNLKTELPTYFETAENAKKFLTDSGVKL
jgi:hypothetical protein